MILLLDNYDSFTWNLHHYLVQLTSEEVVVGRNDAITVNDAGAFKSIVFSPGPGMPEHAGVMPRIISAYKKNIPMLGICLGHQAIGEAFGAKMENIKSARHGIQKEIIVTHQQDRLFVGIPEKFKSGHYHSWVLSRKEFPEELIITAEDRDGTIMALSHKHYPLSGVQFHPESIMTEHGKTLLKNWLNFTGQL